MKKLTKFFFVIFFFYSSANSENLNLTIKISETGAADQSIYFSGPGSADEWWHIIGGCINSSADLWVYPSDQGGADKWVYLSGPGSADKWVCINNLEELDSKILKILGLRK